MARSAQAPGGTTPAWQANRRDFGGADAVRRRRGRRRRAMHQSGRDRGDDHGGCGAYRRRGAGRRGSAAKYSQRHQHRRDLGQGQEPRPLMGSFTISARDGEDPAFGEAGPRRIWRGPGRGRRRLMVHRGVRGRGASASSRRRSCSSATSGATRPARGGRAPSTPWRRGGSASASSRCSAVSARVATSSRRCSATSAGTCSTASTASRMTLACSTTSRPSPNALAVTGRSIEGIRSRTRPCAAARVRWVDCASQVAVDVEPASAATSLRSACASTVASRYDAGCSPHGESIPVLAPRVSRLGGGRGSARRDQRAVQERCDGFAVVGWDLLDCLGVVNRGQLPQGDGSACGVGVPAVRLELDGE